MSKKPKAPARELATIAAEIHEAFRNDTASIIKRGNLLTEAKAQLKHGSWLSWLDENFDMDERTAQRSMAAAKFAAKYDSAVVFNLSVEALYALGGEIHKTGKWEHYQPGYLRYAPPVVSAAIEEAKTRPVSLKRLNAIALKLTPDPDPEQTIEEAAEAEAEAAEQAEAESILDGPPPDLPTPSAAEPPEQHVASVKYKADRAEAGAAPKTDPNIAEKADNAEQSAARRTAQYAEGEAMPTSPPTVPVYDSAADTTKGYDEAVSKAKAAIAELDMAESKTIVQGETLGDHLRQVLNLMLQLCEDKSHWPITITNNEQERVGKHLESLRWSMEGLIAIDQAATARLVRERAQRLGYKLKRRNKEYRLIGPDGFEISTDDLKTICEQLDEIDGKKPTPEQAEAAA